jgi:hypothetical protein
MQNLGREICTPRISFLKSFLAGFLREGDDLRHHHRGHEKRRRKILRKFPRLFRSRTIHPEQTGTAESGLTNTLKREIVEEPSRNASPVCPLLPLLPSVQISLLTSVRCQRPSLSNVTRSNGNLLKNDPGMSVLFALCSLCFLLFKFLCLLLSAVKDQACRGRGRSRNEEHPQPRGKLLIAR